MNVFSIERLDDDTELVWDRIAVAEKLSPFVRPAWFRCWVAAFGESSNFRVAVLRRDGVVVAVLPVLDRGNSLRGPTNNETPMIDAVATDSEARHGLLKGIFESRYRTIDLNFLPVGGTIESSLSERPENNGNALFSWTSRHQPYIDVGGAWENYQQIHLNARRRREVARLWRRLADTGTAEFEIHNGRQDLEELLDRGFDVEARGWKGRSENAISSTPSTALFYRSAAHWAAGSGILRLAFLTLNSRPIAFCYAFQQNTTMYCVKAGYDEAFASYSPGILLLHRLIRYSFESAAVSRLEMLGKDDRYKMEFAHSTSEQIHAQIFGARASVLDRIAITAAYRAKIALRDSMSESVRARCEAVAEQWLTRRHR